jgi:hypothetical protein
VSANDTQVAAIGNGVVVAADVMGGVVGAEVIADDDVFLSLI